MREGKIHLHDLIHLWSRYNMYCALASVSSTSFCLLEGFYNSYMGSSSSTSCSLFTFYVAKFTCTWDINNHLLFDILNILLDIKGFWGSQFTHVEGKVGSHEYSLFAWNLQMLVPILFHCKYCMKIFHVWVNFVANGDYVTVPLYSPNTTSHRELSKFQRNLIIAHNYQHRWAFLISLLTRESPN